jgi:hypothetical protein
VLGRSGGGGRGRASGSPRAGLLPDRAVKRPAWGSPLGTEFVRRRDRDLRPARDGRRVAQVQWRRDPRRLRSRARARHRVPRRRVPFPRVPLSRVPLASIALSHVALSHIALSRAHIALSRAVRGGRPGLPRSVELEARRPPPGRHLGRKRIRIPCIRGQRIRRQRIRRQRIRRQRIRRQRIRRQRIRRQRIRRQRIRRQRIRRHGALCVRAAVIAAPMPAAHLTQPVQSLGAGDS